MREPNRRYAKEFKQEAIRLAASSDKDLAEIERELGITPGRLSAWRKKYQVNAETQSLGLTDRADWNNSTLIKAEVVAEIARLKQQAGRDITVHGSATLVQTLLRHDLVDCVRLLVYPVVLGQGKRLFQAGTTATLRLVETRSFSTGVAALVYAPGRAS